MATEPQFAGIFTMADQASIDGQRRQMRMLRFELGTVLAGAFLGAIDDRTSRIIAAVAFVLAIVMRASRATSNPIADWHQGRAAAESVKTLCWRYAVCANPFGREIDDAEVDREFVQRLDDIMADLSGLHVMPPSEMADEQITAWMRETRSLPVNERQDVYKVQRIDDQRHWYTAKAREAAAQEPALGPGRAAARVRRRRDGRRQPGQHGGLRPVRPRHPARRGRRADRRRRPPGPRPSSSATSPRRTPSPTRS